MTCFLLLNLDCSSTACRLQSQVRCDFDAVNLPPVDSWQDHLMLSMQYFPVAVCSGGLRVNRCRVVDRSRYSPSFDVHNRILWLRLGREPFDEIEKGGEC